MEVNKERKRLEGGGGDTFEMEGYSQKGHESMEDGIDD